MRFRLASSRTWCRVRQAFGPLAMDRPFPDSTFGPTPEERRPNTGCAVLYGLNFCDNSEDEIEGDYVSLRGGENNFRHTVLKFWR